jgi:thiamine biosynthesis lipoprotein
MGVDFRIVTYGTDQRSADHAARAAFNRIAELNKSFSDYDADSELRRLGSADKVGKAQAVSKELGTVLSSARSLCEQTNGAFDVTVGPCILLWRQARGRHRLPPPEKLALARSRVGLDKWTLDKSSQTLTTHVHAMRFDLGAIAKGYAADAALAVLQDAGFPRSLVDGGGDIALGAAPPGERGWRVRIAGGDGEMDLVLHDCGIATSGDTEQYIELEGTRYSHIVDPRTGIGMINRALVTTIADSAMLADAAASAVTVLDAKTGLAWAQSQHIQVRYESLTGTPKTIVRTPQFPAEQRPIKRGQP